MIGILVLFIIFVIGTRMTLIKRIFTEVKIRANLSYPRRPRSISENFSFVRRLFTKIQK